MEKNSQETGQRCQQVFEESSLHSEHSYLFELSSGFNWTLGLMDLFAYCTKKRLIRRQTPFNKASQHAIRQQLRKIVCWWRVRVEQAIKFKLKLLQNKRRESWAHSNRTQLSVRSCGDSFRNLKSEIQNVLLRNEIRN